MIQIIKKIYSYKHTLISFTTYAVLALAAYWPIYPADPSQLPNCGCEDVAQSAWFFAWSPFALFHGMNPYSTTWINYPTGANLAISAQYFLYAVLLAPVTYLMNAIASYNLILWASFVLSALSMYVVVNKLFSKFLPAFLAGLFYGFSPYMVSEGLGHLNLMFIPFPPLIFYSLYKIFCSESNHKYRWSVLLSIFIIFQYMMSSEILATTAIMSLIGLAILAIAHPHKIVTSIQNTVLPLLLCIAIVAIFLSYPIYYSIYGPQHLIAPGFSWNNPYRADLLGTIIPNNGQLLYPLSWKNKGSSFLQGAWYENGSYLGVPLIISLGLILIWLRKNPWVRFLSVMAFAAWLLSLGPYLTINGHTTSIPLPFDLLAHVPILNNILPSRIAMYSDLFIALLLAIGINQLAISNFFISKNLDLSNKYKFHFINFLHRFTKKRIGLIILLAVACILSLIPAWPYTAESPPIANTYSSFFTNDKDAIPKNAVALTYPYPFVGYNQAMVWQLLSNMRFRLLGGYDLFTIPPGYPDPYPAILQPENIESVFSYEADQTDWPLTGPPVLSEVTSKNISSFVHNNGVQIIIVNKEAPNSNFIIKILSVTFGMPAKNAYGIDLWILNDKKTR